MDLKIVNAETITWLKKHMIHEIKSRDSMQPYLMTKNQYKQYIEIQNVFNNFDLDGSSILFLDL